MRPVRLSIKGFTAFRDEQTVEFDGLDLFAIAGPTGAGKSSIMDAITYALFGYVERVGRQCAQLISQGQPRMAVTFEFAAGDRRYRVTRTTAARGATRIQLERLEGADWVQAGEGADRVREVDRMIRAAIGLDYDAFTRTVLLPQGKFAEFLVGDARERRAILTELLGLELFERLGRLANNRKRDAEAEANARAGLLETEYAGATPEAVEEAERAAEVAHEREATLEAAERRVREVAERWADAERTIRELRTCERDLSEAARIATSVAQALEEVTRRAADTEAARAERTKAVTVAERALAKATAARERAESSGDAVALATLRGRAEALVETRSGLQREEAELERSRSAIPALEQARQGAADALAAAAADDATAREAVTAAEEALEEARHADLVAAVRAGLHVGDDCPVCGAKVARLPRAAKAVSLARAQAALDRTRTKAARAAERLVAAQREADRTAHEVETATTAIDRSERELSAARAELERVEAELAEALGRKLPADPVAEIERRQARLQALVDAETEAEEVLDEAREALAAVERARAALDAELAAGRGRLEGLAVAGLFERARALAGDVPPAPAPLRGGEDAGELAAVAAALAATLGGVAERLGALAEERSGGELEVVREAVAHLDGLLEVEATELAKVVEAASGARTSAAREAATARERATRVREHLEHAGALRQEVARLRERAAVFEALGRELRQDRVIAFLQVEALQLLAAAGSERLAALSRGRYRLEVEGDEFDVVDTWNGEERRSARTLSGGETFLASLSLALALSEQIRALAVTEHARLDSLFLDEGFGTLDPESLEVVIEAIEQLGGDGRVVGVITHVPELAVRLPARIEVSMSPRGSRLRVVV